MSRVTYYQEVHKPITRVDPAPSVRKANVSHLESSFKFGDVPQTATTPSSRFSTSTIPRMVHESQIPGFMTPKVEKKKSFSFNMFATVSNPEVESPSRKRSSNVKVAEVVGTNPAYLATKKEIKEIKHNERKQVIVKTVRVTDYLGSTNMKTTLQPERSNNMVKGNQLYEKALYTEEVRCKSTIKQAPKITEKHGRLGTSNILYYPGDE